MDNKHQEIDFIDEKKKLYEVKYKEILEANEDIDPYELTNKSIDFIIKDTTKIQSFNLYNLKPSRLSEFLLR